MRPGAVCNGAEARFLNGKRFLRVNVVNVVNVYKSITFTTYPHESKGLVNVVNVV